jgi:hypothetical protein
MKDDFSFLKELHPALRQAGIYPSLLATILKWFSESLTSLEQKPVMHVDYLLPPTPFLYPGSVRHIGVYNTLVEL